MLSTSPQSPAGSTRHRQKPSGLARAGSKEQILLACQMRSNRCAWLLGKQHSKLGQPPLVTRTMQWLKTLRAP